MSVETVAVLVACAWCRQEMAPEPDDLQCLPLHLHEGATCPGSYGPGEKPGNGPGITRPYTLAEIDAAAAQAMLDQINCAACGRAKKMGIYVLCQKCFKSLPLAPPQVRLNLYLKPGEGLERAIKVALEYLGRV